MIDLLNSIASFGECEDESAATLADALNWALQAGGDWRLVGRYTNNGRIEGIVCFATGASRREDRFGVIWWITADDQTTHPPRSIHYCSNCGELLCDCHANE